MIGLQGAGWLTSNAYGQARARTCVSYAGRCKLSQLGKTDGFFRYPIRHFGRFEPITQQVCYTTALALADAGIDYAEGRRLNSGLIASSTDGCVLSNVRFFEDYIDGGRTLSRANLFIYTLPSSPLAEAAVHFGLQGPLLYLCRTEDGGLNLFESAARILRNKEADSMLIYLFDESSTICMTAAGGNDAIVVLDNLSALASPEGRVNALIEKFNDERNACEN